MLNVEKLIPVIIMIWALFSSPSPGIDCYNEIPPDILKVDVSALIHIKTEAEAATVRKKIIDYLWPVDGYPANKMPKNVTADAPQWMDNIGGNPIERVERLDIEMAYGMHSIAYVFHPQKEVNRLLIFHMGHLDDVLMAGGKETIAFFLDKGFSVMTFWMPFCGENDVPITLPGKGMVRLEGGATGKHNQMADLLDNDHVRFIRFFLEPVVIAINYVEKNHDYHDINMTGISGGGWTTNLCAAIEPRISYAFPVAGSVPLYLREEPCYAASKGDAEQWWPSFYQNVASYPDLYILGGYGEGRKLVQVYNKYDSCCFFGIGHQTFEPFIIDAIDKLGKGVFKIYLDDTHRDHKISQKVIEEVIWPEIALKKPGRQQLPERQEK